MIQSFVDKFMANKEVLRKQFAEKHPERYVDIVKMVVQQITVEGGYEAPDPKRIHEVDDGDCQGTLLFVIGANNYQPSKYWYVYVSYGSCGGCDLLYSIRGSSCNVDNKPSKIQVEDYMTMALHIVQRLKEME